MHTNYTLDQIKKIIANLPQDDQNLILAKLEQNKGDWNFAKAYGLDPKNFTRTEIEMGFGQVI